VLLSDTMLIDSHCHIDVEAFNHDREQVISSANDAGIKKIIVPAIKASAWDNQLTICLGNQSLYPALGLHPIFQHEHKESDLKLLEQYVKQYKPIAIGEIGLDFYIDNYDRDAQIYFLQQQLDLAQQEDLPVILHVRKAHDQMLSCLKPMKLKGGICHAFNGSLQQAEQYIDLGFKLGFGGMLTYLRSSKIRKLAQVLPLESLVLETDAPDMVVASHQGERNSPEYLPECLSALSELRELDTKEVAAITTQNCLELFDLA